MSTAYKCDCCEELFEDSRQIVSLEYADGCYLTVTVGKEQDLCLKCVLSFLKKAIKELS